MLGAVSGGRPTSFTGFFGGGGGWKDEDAEFYYFVDSATGQVWRERKDCLYLSVDEDEDEPDSLILSADGSWMRGSGIVFTSSTSSSSSDEYGRNIDLSWVEDENERLQRARWERHQQRKEIRRRKRRRKEREERRRRREEEERKRRLQLKQNENDDEDEEEKKGENADEGKQRKATEEEGTTSEQSEVEGMESSSSGWEPQEMEEREIRERTISLRALRMAAGLAVQEEEEDVKLSKAQHHMRASEWARQGFLSTDGGMQSSFSGSFRRLLREENTKGGQTLLVMSASPIVKRKEKERKRRLLRKNKKADTSTTAQMEESKEENAQSTATGKPRRALAMSDGSKFRKTDENVLSDDYKSSVARGGAGGSSPQLLSTSPQVERLLPISSYTSPSSSVTFNADHREKEKTGGKALHKSGGVKLDMRALKERNGPSSPDEDKKKKKKEKKTSRSMIYSRESTLKSRELKKERESRKEKEKSSGKTRVTVKSDDDEFILNCHESAEENTTRGRSLTLENLPSIPLVNQVSISPSSSRSSSSASSSVAVTSPRSTAHAILSKSTNSFGAKKGKARIKVKRAKSEEEMLSSMVSSPRRRSDGEGGVSGPESATDSGSSKLYSRRADSEGEDISRRHLQSTSDEDSRSEPSGGSRRTTKKKDKISRAEKKKQKKREAELQGKRTHSKKEKRKLSKKDKKGLSSGCSHSERSEGEVKSGGEDSGSEKRVRAKDKIVRPSLDDMEDPATPKSSRRTETKDSRVGDFLRSLGLEKYEEVFVREEIDWMALRLMQVDHFKELGIPMGPRTKIAWGLEERAKAEQEVKPSPEPQAPITLPTSGGPESTAPAHAPAPESQVEPPPTNPVSSDKSKPNETDASKPLLVTSHQEYCPEPSEKSIGSSPSTVAETDAEGETTGEAPPTTTSSPPAALAATEPSAVGSASSVIRDTTSPSRVCDQRQSLSPQENRQRILGAIGRAQVLRVKASDSQRKAQTITPDSHLVQELQQQRQQEGKANAPKAEEVSVEKLGIRKGHTSQLRARFEVLATESETQASTQPTSLSTSGNMALRKRLFLSERSLPRVQSGATVPLSTAAERQERNIKPLEGKLISSSSSTAEQPAPTPPNDQQPAVIEPNSSKPERAPPPPPESPSVSGSERSAEFISIITSSECHSTSSHENLIREPPQRDQPHERVEDDEGANAAHDISNSPSDYSEGDFDILWEKQNEPQRRKSSSPRPPQSSTQKTTTTVRAKVITKESSSSRPIGKEKKDRKQKSANKSKKSKAKSSSSDQEEDVVEETGVHLCINEGSTKSSKKSPRADGTSSSKKKKHKRSNSAVGIKTTANKIVIAAGKSSGSNAIGRDRGIISDDSDAPIVDDAEDVANMPRELKRRKSWSSPSQKVPDKIDRSGAVASSVTSSPVTKKSIRLNSSMSVGRSQNAVKSRRNLDGQQNISINTRTEKNSIITKLDLSFAGVSYQITSSPFSSGDTDEDSAENNSYESEAIDNSETDHHKRVGPPSRSEQKDREAEKARIEREADRTREREKSIELERIEREREREERLKEELRQRERDGLISTGGQARPHHPFLQQHKGDSARFSFRNLFTPRSNSKRGNSMSASPSSSPPHGAGSPSPSSSGGGGLNSSVEGTALKSGFRGDISSSGGAKGRRSGEMSSGSGSESAGNSKARRDRDRDWEKAIDRERERRQREREKLREREKAAYTTRRRAVGADD